MGTAIGEMVPLAIGIAISPLVIVAVTLILTTPRARTNGPAFLGGWLLGLAAVGGVKPKNLILIASSGITTPVAFRFVMGGERRRASSTAGRRGSRRTPPQ